MNPSLAATLRSRREFIRVIGAGAALFNVPGLFAQELALTPPSTEGPFYPDHIPLDKDNDLLIVNDSITPAVGEITHLSGRILDRQGQPIRNALVEIWQVDSNAVYLHSGSANSGNRDSNFQGFGQFVTGFTGEYRFRTIKPVLYPGRTRHIHFAVKLPGREKWTTQCYVKGEPRNETDGVLRGIADAKARESVQVDFAPIPDSRIGELAARFDIVMGFTPADVQHPGGNLLIAAAPVSAGASGRQRFRVEFKAFKNFAYEIHRAESIGTWPAVIPFSFSADGPTDQNVFVAASDSAVSLFVEQKSSTGFYVVYLRQI